MSKSRVFLYILLVFIAGIAVGSFIDLPVFFVWMGCLVGISVIIRHWLIKNRFGILAGVLLVIFFLGILRIDLTEKSKPDLGSFYNRHSIFRGIVWEEPEIRDQYTRLKIKLHGQARDISAYGQAEGLPVERNPVPKTTVYPLASPWSSGTGIKTEQGFFILATIRNYPEYKLGDELSLEGKLEKPQSSEEFDYAAYLARQEIFTVSYFPKIEKTGEGKISKFRLYLSRLKNSFEEKIEQILPEPHASFLKGLLLGGRESLPAELVESFRQTGTAHITALSGYNITLVGKFFIILLSAILIPFQIAFWVATIGIACFVLLTGASASVVRAAVMGILVLVAQREGRLYSFTNALVFAGAVMVFHNPQILRFDAAFQLSFLATAGLMYLSPLVENWIYRLQSFGRKKIFDESAALKPKEIEEGFSFRKALIETMSAQIMVLPLLIYLFGQVSLVSPLTNILVIWAVPWSMILGFIMGVAGFISSSLSMILGWVVWILLEYKIVVIEFFAKIPLASVELSSWSLVPLVGIYIWFGYKYVFKN